jgi:hypothetical protein
MEINTRIIMRRPHVCGESGGGRVQIKSRGFKIPPWLEGQQNPSFPFPQRSAYFSFIAQRQFLGISTASEHFPTLI